MRIGFALSAGLLAVIPHSGAALAAGFENAVAPGPAPVEIGIWYPSQAEPPDEPNTPFRQALALGADIDGTRLPLVLLSHGDGGWMGGHAATGLALARAGFVAVGLNHPGNNYEDESATPSTWMRTRPRDITRVIDFMLDDWRGAPRLDAAGIGVFGFSAGGYTALVAAGARPNIQRMIRHCETDPGEFVCHTGMVAEIAASDLVEGAVDWKRDPRIAAISVAAPGFGFAFDAADLSSVRAAVQLWSGGGDKRVPHISNVVPLRQALGDRVRETILVEEAGHFAFLAPCNPALETANPRIWQMVCVDAPGFDREAFHSDMNARVVDFFRAAFGRE